MRVPSFDMVVLLISYGYRTIKFELEPLYKMESVFFKG